MDSVIVVNQSELDSKISKFKEGGVSKLHVLSDFDRTLTKAFVNGEKVPSIISILRDGNYLTQDYADKAHALFNEYHPIEIDLNISLEEKKRAMHDWWSRHFELLIKSGLNKKDIEKVITSDKLILRKGITKFIKTLNEFDVLLVILSSAGLGEESILGVLERDGINYDSIYIVSNSFEWDENGKIISVREPIIHIFNKDETALPKDVHEKVRDRKNVLLLGDSLGDLGMIEGFDYDNLITVGFLNDKVEEHLEEYKKKFDVVITGDGDFSYVNGLLEKITS